MRSEGNDISYESNTKINKKEFGERRGDGGGYWDPDSVDELETASLSRDSIYFDSSGYEKFPESNKRNHNFDSPTHSAGSGNEDNANDLFSFDNKDLELIQGKQPVCKSPY